MKEHSEEQKTTPLPNVTYTGSGSLSLLRRRKQMKRHTGTQSLFLSLPLQVPTRPATGLRQGVEQLQ